MFGLFEMYLLKFEKVVADKKSVGTPDSKGKHKFYEVLEDILCGENPNPEYVEAFNIARNKYIFPTLKGIKKCFELNFGDFFIQHAIIFEGV